MMSFLLLLAYGHLVYACIGAMTAPYLFTDVLYDYLEDAALLYDPTPSGHALVTRLAVLKTEMDGVESREAHHRYMMALRAIMELGRQNTSGDNVVDGMCYLDPEYEAASAGSKYGRWAPWGYLHPPPFPVIFLMYTTEM